MKAAIKKGCTLAGALVAVLAAVTWHGSAHLQEMTDALSGASVEQMRKIVTASLYLNTKAAVLSSVAAGLAVIGELFSE